MRVYTKLFPVTTSAHALFSAWQEFRKGKDARRDVMRFDFALEQNLLDLQRDLSEKTYRHGSYTSFFITDPKQRHIHKATVRDRIVHHVVFRVLNPLFERSFIYDSYSCRQNKGTHRGIYRLEQMIRKVSKNNHTPCYVLKCDIKKFFASVDHAILLTLLEKRISDPDTLWLLKEIIGSFSPGLPIGNLTSQLFANVYLNEFDQFIKHVVKVPHYIRYTDDFVVVSSSLPDLKRILRAAAEFLSRHLSLELHPYKVSIRKLPQGIDFLGYVQFPHHRVLRTKTKRRILKKVKTGMTESALQSYRGVLSHASMFEFEQELLNQFMFHDNAAEK
mgnify:CR=1 FL=1